MNNNLSIERVYKSDGAYTNVRLAKESFDTIFIKSRANEYKDLGNLTSGESVRAYDFNGNIVTSIYNPVTRTSKYFVDNATVAKCYTAKPVVIASIPFSLASFAVAA